MPRCKNKNGKYFNTMLLLQITHRSKTRNKTRAFKLEISLSLILLTEILHHWMR